MIFTDRIITVRKGESKINEPIIVYRGDYELEVRFTIMNSKFKFMSGTNLIESENAAYGQLAILTPYGGNIFSDVAKCNEGTVTFVLTKAMLDQIEEVGLYSFQIRLFDYNKESRVSIPPVEFGIEVREPITSEDHDNSVNNAIVGYSIVKIADALNEEVPDTFNSNGDYNKTIWETGDRITEGKLNKIEDAIDTINENEQADIAALDRRVTSNFNVLQTQVDSKMGINEKIKSSQLDTSSNANKIQLINLADDVQKAMAGTASVNPVIPDGSIVNEKYADRSVTRNKLDVDTNKILDVAEGLMYNYTDNLQVPSIKTLNSATTNAYYSQAEKTIKYDIEINPDADSSTNDALYFETDIMRFRYTNTSKSTFLVTTVYTSPNDNREYVYHLNVQGNDVIMRGHRTTGSSIASHTITNGIINKPVIGDLMTFYTSSTEIKLDGESSSGETYNVFTITKNDDLALWFYAPVVGFLVTDTGTADISYVNDIRFPSLGIYDIARDTDLQSANERIIDLESEVDRMTLDLYSNEIRIPAEQWVDSGGSGVCESNSVGMAGSNNINGSYDWITTTYNDVIGLKFMASEEDGWYVLETNSDNTLALAVSANYNNKESGKGGYVRVFADTGRGELMEATFINTSANSEPDAYLHIERTDPHKYLIRTKNPGETDYTDWLEVDLNIIDGMSPTGSTMTEAVIIDLQDFHTSLGSILYSGYANRTLMADVIGIASKSSSFEDTILGILEDLNINSANVVDLVMFMGQSNMAGRGVAAESPVVPVGHGYEFRAISDPTKLYPIVEPFGVNENNSSSGVSESTKTGSMVSSFVSNYYKVTKVPIVAVSCSKGGTNISWWQPDGGPLNDAIARHDLAKNWLETNGYVIRHDFMVWCQGCSDGDGRTSADDYTQGIKNMIEAMMTCGVEKCFLVRIGNHRDDSTMYDDIIQAQTELCKTYENAVLVSCKLAEMAELGLMKDQFHYLQEGYNIVGKDAGINTAFYINNLKEPTMWDPENDNLYFSYK